MSGWRARAACRDAPAADVLLAFGTGEEQQQFVQRHCVHCPVTDECFSVGHDEWGVWGGLTEKKRGDLLGNRRVRTREANRGCGSPYAYRVHRENGEEPCPECLQAWTGYCQERKRIRLGRTA